MLPHQNPIHTSTFPIRATCPAHLILLVKYIIVIIMIICLYGVDRGNLPKYIWSMGLNIKFLNMKYLNFCQYIYRKACKIFVCTKLNSVALVRERTIPTERPPPVGEVSANFCG
jgi:hypothetical protein